LTKVLAALPRSISVQISAFLQERRQAINKITDDPASIRLLFALARRRCTVLVAHYRPEVEAVAAALLRTPTLIGEDVGQIVRASLQTRLGALLCW